MLNKIKLLGLFSFCVGNGLLAQEIKVLTLPEAINYALENKADAEKARLNISKSEAQIAEVKASAFPKITLNSALNYNPLLQQTVMPNFTNPSSSQKLRISLGQEWQSSNTVQLQQMIFSQAVFTGLKAAKTTKEFYLINAQLTEEQIIENVAKAYYQVYQAEQMLDNINDNFSIAEKTSRIIKGLFDAGLAKKIDYDRVIVSLNNIKSSRQQVVNSVELAKNSLKYMTGIAMDENVELPKIQYDALDLVSEEVDFSERTELKVLSKQIELLQLKKKASQAEYYPTVALVGSYGWLGQGKNIPLWNGEKNGVYWSSSATIGLNISIPIFNGFSTRSKIQQDKIELDKAELDLKDTKLALDMAYRNAVNRLKNSDLMIKNQESNVKLANEVMENTRANYQYGLATLNDILDAEKDLAEAKNNLTNARLDYKIAEIQLLKSQGKLRNLNK